MAAERNGADLARVLRALLKELLDRDLERRIEQRPDLSSNCESADVGAIIGSFADADIASLTAARDGIANDLANGTPDDVGEAEADAMLAHYGLPSHLRRGLIAGVIQANLRAWKHCAATDAGHRANDPRRQQAKRLSTAQCSRAGKPSR